MMLHMDIFEDIHRDAWLICNIMPCLIMIMRMINISELIIAIEKTLMFKKFPTFKYILKCIDV